MNSKLTIIAKRKEFLLNKVAVEREAFAQHIGPLRITLMTADKGISILRYIKSHPVLMIGPVALITLLRPSKVGHWLQGGWVVFKMSRKIKLWLNH